MDEMENKIEVSEVEEETPDESVANKKGGKAAAFAGGAIVGVLIMAGVKIVSRIAKDAVRNLKEAKKSGKTDPETDEIADVEPIE